MEGLRDVLNNYEVRCIKLHRGPGVNRFLRVGVAPRGAHAAAGPPGGKREGRRIAPPALEDAATPGRQGRNTSLSVAKCGPLVRRTKNVPAATRRPRSSRPSHVALCGPAPSTPSTSVRTRCPLSENTSSRVAAVAGSVKSTWLAPEA